MILFIRELDNYVKGNNVQRKGEKWGARLALALSQYVLNSPSVLQPFFDHWTPHTFNIKDHLSIYRHMEEVPVDPDMTLSNVHYIQYSVLVSM